MYEQSLATKYRPRDFESLSEQDAVNAILKRKLERGDLHPLLFVGPSGCGKTTCARIYANHLNQFKGGIYELDAATNNGVDSIRQLLDVARMSSIESKYKVFIIDECHQLSGSAWSALLKTLEDLQAGVLFILCTTEPRKVIPTILSRVQRFDFKRISYDGIKKRLNWIIEQENAQGKNIIATDEGISYVAKLASGGMRLAITYLDTCLSLSNDLSYENVCSSLGVTPYETLFTLANSIIRKESSTVVELIDSLYLSGVDMKQFIADYSDFLLDVVSYKLTNSFSNIRIPDLYKQQLVNLAQNNELRDYLFDTVNVANQVKYDERPKFGVVVGLLKQCEE
jgi:DNA polymerase-3 subunit gamma/tau